MAKVHYILVLLSIFVGIIAVIIYRSKNRKDKGSTFKKDKRKGRENYVNLILNYFQGIETDYYNDFLHNYLSVKFDIDELDEDYKYQVKNIKSILDLGVPVEELTEGNNFLKVHSAGYINREVNETPDIALTFLISLSRNSGKLKALKYIESKYAVKQRFPEEYNLVENDLLETRQELLSGL